MNSNEQGYENIHQYFKFLNNLTRENVKDKNITRKISGDKRWKIIKIWNKARKNVRTDKIILKVSSIQNLNLSRPIMPSKLTIDKDKGYWINGCSAIETLLSYLVLKSADPVYKKPSKVAKKHIFVSKWSADSRTRFKELRGNRKKSR